MTRRNVGHDLTSFGLVLLACIFWPLAINAQVGESTEGLRDLLISKSDVYQWYTAEGNSIDFQSALKHMEAADVVLFGELHDHPVIHWLQLRTAKALIEKKPLVMGGEMFETDQQLLLDEYIPRKVNDKRFEADARMWTNYKTDYKPLLQLAREHSIPFVATNVPRRYAGLVSQYGLDSLKTLSPAARALLPPLPIPFTMEVPGYQEMIGMMHGGMGMGMNPENFVMAQALKDASMAHRIALNSKTGRMFLHFNGDYHSADYGGIYWYLKQYAPGLKVLTIKVQTEDRCQWQDEWKDSGDLILVVPDDFTRTH